MGNVASATTRSHELRTPLTLLKTRIQLALRRPRTVTEHEQILAEIQTDIVRLTQLADQLLQIGRSAYALERNSEPTDLAAAVSEEVARRHRLRGPDSHPDAELALRLGSHTPVLVKL
jgi:two-component system, OmpR family, sensor kinase